MTTEAEHRGAVAGLRKAAQQLQFYGAACEEARLELVAMADRWDRVGPTPDSIAEIAELLRHPAA